MVNVSSRSGEFPDALLALRKPMGAFRTTRYTDDTHDDQNHLDYTLLYASSLAPIRFRYCSKLVPRFDKVKSSF
jgi:hypothetical protein